MVSLQAYPNHWWLSNKRLIERFQDTMCSEGDIYRPWQPVKINKMCQFVASIIELFKVIQSEGSDALV